MSLRITIVLGTARAERSSERVFRALCTHCQAVNEVVVTPVDVREYVTLPSTIPAWEVHQAVTPWRQVAAETDVFVFVLPEYNHSFPGEWKLLIDSAYQEYAGKRAYRVGVSGGTFAGARVVDHVVPVLLELGLHVQKEVCLVGQVDDVITNTGAVCDPKTAKRLTEFVRHITAP